MIERHRAHMCSVKSFAGLWWTSNKYKLCPTKITLRHWAGSLWMPHRVWQLMGSRNQCFSWAECWTFNLRIRSNLERQKLRNYFVVILFTVIFSKRRKISTFWIEPSWWVRMDLLIWIRHHVKCHHGCHYFNCDGAGPATSAQPHSSKNSASDVQPKS